MMIAQSQALSSRRLGEGFLAIRPRYGEGSDATLSMMAVAGVTEAHRRSLAAPPTVLVMLLLSVAAASIGARSSRTGKAG